MDMRKRNVDLDHHIHMKRVSTSRVLLSGTGWCKRKCPPVITFPKNDELFSSEEKSFKVSTTGELHPFSHISDSYESKEADENPEPSVEVHFRPDDIDTVEHNILPIYEVIVNSDAVCESDVLEQVAPEEEEENETLLCLTDTLITPEQVENFQDFNETTSLQISSTSDLCRICACTGPDLVPIFGDDGQELQLANKIIRHLPITVCASDRLPLHVCETCIAQLNMCHELVRICSETDLRLRLLLDEEDRQKECQAMSVLNVEKVSGLEEVDIDGLANDIEQNKWASNQEPKLNQEVESTFTAPIKSTLQNPGVLQEGKKPKFKVVVVKLSNSNTTMSKEAQIAKALEMIKSSDRAKQQGLSDLDNKCNNWENESINCNQWSTHQFICSVCNENLVGTSNFLQHQRNMHDIELHHCNTCNIFYDSEAQLEQHSSEQHPCQAESNDNVKITNVAEIQLMNSCQTTSSNICMKVSKEFDKMDKSLKSKIVGAIQGLVLQDQLVKFQCGFCKEHFSTKESLKKHCKELQHKFVRPINCSLCKKKFNNYTELQEHKQVSHDDLKSFICNYCEMKFLTKRLLLKHITQHAEYKAFICRTCGKGYNSKSGFEIHLSTHNTEKPYLCDLCGKSFKHVSNLKGHKRSHLSEEDKKRHGCPYCEKRFRCKFLVDEHIRMHTGERPFSCDICNKRFCKRQQLKQHTLVHSNDSYECHICGSRFNRRGNMTEHIKKHMKTKRYTCRVCKETFETISQVVAHRKTHSNEEFVQSKILDDSMDKDGTSSFQCHICQKVLATKLSLVSHLRIHTGEKPFECEFCGQRFSQKPALTYHRRRHTGEKPYVCSHCNEGFLSRNAKNIHERIHTGEKPYSCYVCGTAFRCASSLTQHLLVHSDHRPFSCHHCNKCFRRREALQVHLRIHTGEKPYACDLCGRAFTQRGDMVKHKRIHSNNRPHHCKHCDFVSTSRKELKKHEAFHPMDSDSILITSENLVTSFPEITIVGQDCESMILGGNEEQEIVDDEIN